MVMRMVECIIHLIRAYAVGRYPYMGLGRPYKRYKYDGGWKRNNGDWNDWGWGWDDRRFERDAWSLAIE